jgi:hypothetical protein
MCINGRLGRPVKMVVGRDRSLRLLVAGRQECRVCGGRWEALHDEGACPAHRNQCRDNFGMGNYTYPTYPLIKLSHREYFEEEQRICKVFCHCMLSRDCPPVWFLGTYTGASTQCKTAQVNGVKVVRV